MRCLKSPGTRHCASLAWRSSRTSTPTPPEWARAACPVGAAACKKAAYPKPRARRRAFSSWRGPRRTS
eukprot:3730404-Pyramimonas_sp.AAC.1